MLIYLFIFSSPTLLHLHFSLPSNLKSSLFKPTHIPITITITIYLSFLLSSSHHRMVSTKSTTRRLSCGLRNIPITPVFIPCSYAVLHNTSAVPLSQSTPFNLDLSFCRVHLDNLLFTWCPNVFFIPSGVQSEYCTSHLSYCDRSSNLFTCDFCSKYFTSHLSLLQARLVCLSDLFNCDC